MLTRRAPGNGGTRFALHTLPLIFLLQAPFDVLCRGFVAFLFVCRPQCAAFEFGRVRGADYPGDREITAFRPRAERPDPGKP